MVAEKTKEQEILKDLFELDTNLRSSGYTNIKLKMIRAKIHIIGNLKLLNEIKPLPEKYHFFKEFKDSKDILYYIDKLNKISNLVFKDVTKTTFLNVKETSKKIFDNVFSSVIYDFDLLYKFCSLSQNLYEMYEIEEKICFEIYAAEKSNSLNLKELVIEYDNAKQTLNEVQEKHMNSEINFFRDFVKKNDIRLFETIEAV